MYEAYRSASALSRQVRARSQLATCAMAWRVGAHVLSGMAQIVVLFPRLSKERRGMRVQNWARGMLERFGIELVVVGGPACKESLLLVANHLSWLDIVALHAACYCRFVSKADVARWPLLGTLASGAGTLYVERDSRRDAMRVVCRMAEALKAGDVIAVFPEGTTGDGTSILPFHSSLIQAAITARAPVQAVALRIVDRRSGIPSRAASYMGKESLLGSIWRTLRARELRVVVAFGTLQYNEGRDRRAWAQDLHREIASLLDPLRSAPHPC